MTPHERELILGVAGELRTTDRSAIDPEAERLIRTEIVPQPHAAYLLTQRVIVQQLALRQAQAKIDELEARMRQAGGGPGRSFLGGAESPPQPSGAPQTGGSPVASAPPSGGGVGSFLKTAAAAAAGTIGGQLIYDGVRHLAAGHWSPPELGGMFGGGSPGGFIPGGRQAAESDYATDSAGSDRVENWGGGGDFGTDQPNDDVEDQDVQVEDEDSASQDDWQDDDQGDSDNGGGSDW